MRLLAVGMAFLVACAPARPGFQGPVPLDVVEITYDRSLCLERVCERTITIIHRLGGAHRAYYTGEEHDSTRLSGIDSASFQAAVDQLDRLGVFRRLQGAPPSVGWPSIENWAITVTTGSGSRTAYYSAPSRELPAFGNRRAAQIEEFLARLRWHVPVR